MKESNKWSREEREKGRKTPVASVERERVVLVRIFLRTKKSSSRCREERGKEEKHRLPE
jgi:hypothetical protein